MNKQETAVLVVGGRTTGLTMACELARHGVPVRIIDQSPGIDPHCAGPQSFIPGPSKSFRIWVWSTTSWLRA